MSGIRIEGNTSGNVVEVDSNNNLFTNLPTVINDSGYVAVVHEIDSGSIVGTPTRRTPYVSHDQRIRTGVDTTIFDYFFTATTQDTGVWKYTFATLTASQPGGGFLLMNALGTATASGNYAYMSTWRVFPLEARGGLHVRFDTLMTVAPLANQVVEIGLFLPVAGTAPADGVYFRITSAGIQGVVNYNGTETSTGVTTASPPIGSTNTFSMEIYAGGVEFYLNGILQQILVTPAGDSEPFISVTLPLTIQQRNSGIVSGSPQMQFKVGSCHVDFLEIQSAMPYSHQQAAEGLSGQQAPQGNTMGSTALYSNNLAVGAGAVMTNTTAALGVGLGGQFTGQPTLTVGQDAIICSYANPVGTTAIPSRILMITGVKITSMVTATLTGGPGYFIYALNFGHTSVSLATGESASFATGTTKKPRSIVLGWETFVVTAAAGTLGSASGTTGVTMTFNSPIAVNPLEFVSISAKNVGTAFSSTGTITWLVAFDAYWI